jgi:F-type H+-transporting ATPase subunit a
LEQFVIRPLVPLHIAGYDVSFTQSSLWMLIGVLLATTLFTLSFRKKSVVPGRWQNVSEMMYDTVSNLIDENLGEKGRAFFPFIFSIFIVVLMGNLMGLIPYSFTYTSHIIVTGTLALLVFFVATVTGFVKHGLHFFSFFLPAGVPWPLAPLIIAIEVISYLSRPFSLSVRLFANMVAGHTMLKVFAGFSVSLLAIAFGQVLGFLPVFINTALLGLETMIAFIQAYVFTVLTCMYIKDALELH